ncbi:MAG: DUF2442 domain-containing protein [Thermoleophilaceae bacterium]
MTGAKYDITTAAVVRHGVLKLTFRDGLSGEVEVLDRMNGPVFADARTPSGFARVTVDSETGTVVWPGDADLAPDTLYERVRTGAWPQDPVGASGAATS